MEFWLRRLGPSRPFNIPSSRMLKRGEGVAGTIPLLAQRAVEDSPRWTRAVGIIPPTPYEGDDDLRACVPSRAVLSPLENFEPPQGGGVMRIRIRTPDTWSIGRNSLDYR